MGRTVSGNWRRIGTLAAVAATAAVALAAAGDLDAGFGSGGVVQFDYGSNPRSDQRAARRAVVQPDGKAIVAGWDGVGTAYVHWRVRRLNADGSADASFGSGGSAVLFGDDGDSMLEDYALDASGRVVACGRATVSVTTGTGKKAKTTTTSAPTIARLTSGGALDTSFGNGGYVMISLPSPARNVTVGALYAGAVAVQTDGRIVVAGSCTVASKTSSHPAIYLARLTSAGALDASFGSGGTVLSDLSSGYDTLVQAAIALQSDGRILVGSSTGGNSGWQIRRLLPNGSADTGFADIRSASDSLQAMAVDGYDRIVAAGGRFYAPNVCDMLAVRYLPGGSPDASFGSGGAAVVHDGTQSEAASVAVASDGSVVFTAGVWPTPGVDVFGAVAVRLTSAGALDTSFGSGGVTAPITIAANENYASGVAVAPDGKYVATGTLAGPVSGTWSYSWFVARWNAN